MSLAQTIAHLFHPRRSNNHRPRILHPELLALFSVIVVACSVVLYSAHWVSQPLGSVLGYSSTISPTEVLALTNVERAHMGLPALTLNTELSQAALAKGQHMISNHYWAHTAPDGTQPWAFIKNSGYVYQVAGENLARDFSTTDDMVAAWMASPTHKANIVNTKYEDIGIAVIDGELEGFETTLVVQMFGKQREGGTATVTAPAAVAREPAVIAIEDRAPTVDGAGTPERPAVLASFLVSEGSVTLPPLFTPIQVTKAIFLAIIMIIMATLGYDALVIGHRSTVRLVGQNAGHLLLLGLIAFLVIFFKGGVIG